MSQNQVKVLNTGQLVVGASNVCASSAKLQVTDGTNNIVIAPNDGGTNVGGYIQGSNPARLNFWHPVAKWNKVKFKSYALASDSTLKTNICPLTDATSKLKQIKTYSYYLKQNLLETEIALDSLELDSSFPVLIGQKDYGVLAQEVERIMPELVDTAKGNMFVNYNAFIGILIAGFNEQQTVIENLQSETQTLQEMVAEQEKTIIALQELIIAFQEIVKECCNNSTPRGGENSLLIEDTQQSQKQAFLYQNTPNPFSSNTEITCNLPETAKQAVIYIYNLQGVELKSYRITQTGYNRITIHASELPAGMYLYSLVVDNEIIDTKRMILTK
jgi:hypothetical protein